jgi:phage protein D
MMSQGFDILLNAVPDPTLPVPGKVEVVEAVGAWTSYRLSYGLNIQEGDLPLLNDARIGPESELAVRVPNGDAVEILVNGPVTEQRIEVVTGGEGSSVEVCGGDKTVAMARESKIKVWPTTTDAAALMEILGAHALTPDVTLTSTVAHDETRNALTQRETDLAFVRRIARRNGCWFWLTYDPLLGLATAHVKRPPVDGLPAATLVVNGEGRNLDTASIAWNTERTASVAATSLDVRTLQDMTGDVERSPLTGLASQALADIAPAVRKSRLTLPVDDAGDLIVRSEAALIDAGWCVSATVTAKYSVLGKVLRAHTLVELGGVGSRHSGKYLVERVEHRIDADDHVMHARLIRNGWN